MEENEKEMMDELLFARKSPRLQVEEALYACWGITSDLDFVCSEILESPDMSKDEIANILLGIHQMYNRRFDDLWRKIGVEWNQADSLRETMSDLQRNYNLTPRNKPVNG